MNLPADLQLKPLAEFPNNDYMAGSDGKIYSRKNYAVRGSNEDTSWHPLQGHISRGYVTVSLCHNQKTRTLSVHRLICEAFHGSPPTPAHQARHLNGIRQDNSPGNLSWGTRQENWADRIAHGHGLAGERNPMAKLSDEHRRHIRFAVEKGLCSRRHISRMLGMSNAAIVAVCQGGQITQADHAAS